MRRHSHSLSATGNLLSSADLNHNKQIYLSLLIKPLQSLYLSRENNKSVAKLSLGELEISITASKSEN